jgi:hypothetical protein
VELVDESLEGVAELAVGIGADGGCPAVADVGHDLIRQAHHDPAAWGRDDQLGDLWMTSQPELAAATFTSPTEGRATPATDPATTPATGDAVKVVFQTLNRYLGVAVGEHLGYLFTGLSSALVGVALLQSDCYIRCSGSSGWRRSSCSAPWSLSDRSPQGWKPAGMLVPLAYIGWSLWLLALGVGLLVTA